MSILSEHCINVLVKIYLNLVCNSVYAPTCKYTVDLGKFVFNLTKSSVLGEEQDNSDDFFCPTFIQSCRTFIKITLIKLVTTDYSIPRLIRIRLMRNFG